MKRCFYFCKFLCCVNITQDLCPKYSLDKKVNEIIDLNVYVESDVYYKTRKSESENYFKKVCTGNNNRKVIFFSL